MSAGGMPGVGSDARYAWTVQQAPVRHTCHTILPRHTCDTILPRHASHMIMPDPAGGAPDPLQGGIDGGNGAVNAMVNPMVNAMVNAAGDGCDDCASVGSTAWC